MDRLPDEQQPYSPDIEYPGSSTALVLSILAFPLLLVYVLPYLVIAIIAWSRTSQVLDHYKRSLGDFLGYKLNKMRTTHLIAQVGIWLSVALLALMAILYLYRKLMLE